MGRQIVNAYTIQDWTMTKSAQKGICSPMNILNVNWECRDISVWARYTVAGYGGSCHSVWLQQDNTLFRQFLNERNTYSDIGIHMYKMQWVIHRHTAELIVERAKTEKATYGPDNMGINARWENKVKAQMLLLPKTIWAKSRTI